MAERLLTAREAAELEVGPRFSAEWIRIQLRKGTLRGTKVGGRWFTTETALRELVERGVNHEGRGKGRLIA